jgi:hypothetical protein
MTTNAKDEGIRAVREVRERISAECGNDPEKLIEHYIAEQERYSDRLLRPVAAQQDGAADDASRRR